MARNKLSDLNNHLFAQLERLGDEELSSEELNNEINRSKAINGVARNIIDNAKTTLEATKLLRDEIDNSDNIPEQFRIN